MTDDRNDNDAARLFAALGNPVSLRLLLHVLDAGQCDTDVGRHLQIARRCAGAHLDRLVDAGLLARTHADAGTDVYRVADGPRVEFLLATARQLGDSDRDVGRDGLPA